MSQQEYVGRGTLDRLPEILREYNARRILLATAGQSFEASGAASFVAKRLSDMSVLHIRQSTPIPRLEDLERHLHTARTFRPDVVVAIGGGNVLDMAKLVNVFLESRGSPRHYVSHGEPITPSRRPLIAIPTTAGSGSEATHFAVLYLGSQKTSISHEGILPSVAIVDPALTDSLSPSLTALSGIDAFCQAVESYWSVHSNEESMSYARRAIRDSWENLEIAVNKPVPEAREKMSVASHFAGKAINISKTTAPHALSYALTASYGIPHGQAVALWLPFFLEFNYQVSGQDVLDRRGEQHVKQVIEDICLLLGGSNVHESGSMIRRFMTNIGLAVTPSDLVSNTRDAAKTVLSNINEERLSNNPRSISRPALEKLVLTVWARESKGIK